MNTIHLYSPVTAGTLAEVQRQLASFTGKEISVRINSPGGSVFDGLAIYQLLKSHSARVVVFIDGIAASIASMIALAGDEIRIATGAMIMIHDASIATRGNSRELTRDAATVAKVSESLTDIYTQATKQPRAKIREMMEAETWLNASEAVAMGFAHKVVAAQKIAACAWSTKDFPNIPPPALVAAGLRRPAPATRREASATIDRLHSENLKLRAAAAADKTKLPARPFAADSTQNLVLCVRRGYFKGSLLEAAQHELTRRNVIIHARGYSVGKI